MTASLRLLVLLSSVATLPFLPFAGAVGAGCGGASETAVHPTTASGSAKPAEPEKGLRSKEITPYRSDRFGLSLPLPDRPAWLITDRDDASGGWLVATHTQSNTIVRLRRYEESSLVGRHECELRAQLTGELPKDAQIEKGHYETLSDEPVHRPKGWDGRRWVAFEPKAGGQLLGHVFLVSGHAHSCLVVHVLLHAHAESEATDLADRLELFASQIVSNVTVDHAEGPGGLSPTFPNLPPTPGVP